MIRTSSVLAMAALVACGPQRGRIVGLTTPAAQEVRLLPPMALGDTLVAAATTSGRGLALIGEVPPRGGSVRWKALGQFPAVLDVHATLGVGDGWQEISGVVTTRDWESSIYSVATERVLAAARLRCRADRVPCAKTRGSMLSGLLERDSGLWFSAAGLAGNGTAGPWMSEVWLYGDGRERAAGMVPISTLPDDMQGLDIGISPVFEERRDLEPGGVGPPALFSVGRRVQVAWAMPEAVTPCPGWRPLNGGAWRAMPGWNNDWRTLEFLPPANLDNGALVGFLGGDGSGSGRALTLVKVGDGEASVAFASTIPGVTHDARDVPVKSSASVEGMALAWPSSERGYGPSATLLLCDWEGCALGTATGRSGCQLGAVGAVARRVATLWSCSDGAVHAVWTPLERVPGTVGSAPEHR